MDRAPFDDSTLHDDHGRDVWILVIPLDITNDIGLVAADSRQPVVWAGWPFFERGWRSIIIRNLNMLTLIVIGTVAAYVYSLFAVVFPNIFPEWFRSKRHIAIYFEVASVIVVLF